MNMMQRTAPNELRYIAYCRKSSEDDSKQILSIESQERELLNYAERNGLKISGVYKEEKSAHKRGRPVFTQVMDLMETGKADAFLVWQPNRIARNALDGGWVITLMDEGHVKEVRSPFKTYRNTSDDKFVLQIEFGMSKKFSDDLIVNVKRGHRAKILQGWRNGVAPLGYLNNLDRPKGERNIVVDPERFELVHRIFLLYLSGEHSVRKLHKETAHWGLKTRQSRKQGGKPLVLAHIYRILTEPFYAGYFWATNPDTGERELVKGAHEPMITMEQFDLVQAKLGRKGKPRPRSNRFFPYTGKIECGECGSMVTAEEKHQMVCSKCRYKFASHNKEECPKCKTKIEDMKSPKRAHYIYYHCTKRKNPACKQKTMRVELLEGLIDQALAQFQLSDGFTQWALEELAKENEEETKGQAAVISSQQQRYKEVVERIQNLTKLYTSPENARGELLSLEEYAPQRKTLLEEKKLLEQEQQNTGRRIEEWVDWAENSFSFAAAARVWFENGSPEQRRAIFSSLSRSNLTLKDRELSISLRNPLDLYAAIATKYPTTRVMLEPENNGLVKGQLLPFAADVPNLRRGRDSNSRGCYTWRFSRPLH